MFYTRDIKYIDKAVFAKQVENIVKQSYWSTRHSNGHAT